MRVRTPRALALLLLALVPGCGTTTEDSEPYSVLLLTVDTLRPDYLSFSGYDRPTSPVLDSLLADSFYFEEATAPIARTTPALASLLTGAYPHRTGVRTLMSAMDDEIVPVAEALQAAGYQTLATVTNWVLSRGQGLDRGFDQYSAMHDSRDARQTTDSALEMLGDRDPAASDVPVGALHRSARTLPPGFHDRRGVRSDVPRAIPGSLRQSLWPGRWPSRRTRTGSGRSPRT